jgi:alkanesulfonate monooxygenase SsuD/methylene tetrahydromethanopterin reductase-like flavin-dependent oxidoreductase (luciferase family)
MKFILNLFNWYQDWDLACAAAKEADDSGFWGVSMPDHHLWAQGMDDATLDSWVALTQLASMTKSVHLGTIVTAIPFRPPAMLAKMVSTVDVLSNGRTFLGVGAGWSQREFDAYSAWDEPAVRVAKTEEGLRLILALWTEKNVEFQGTYYRSKGGVLEPKPVQKPHPPLLFGGLGPRMLRMAGRFGDIVLMPHDELRFDGTKSVVMEAAEKSRRSTKPSFAASSPVGPGERYPTKYDQARYRSAAIQAEKNGCEYFVFQIPRDGLLDSMRDFAKSVISSLN